MIFPFLLMIVVHSKSRNRNYRAHKLNKERVTITSGTMILFKGTPNTKDLTFMKIYLYQQNGNFYFKETYISGYFVE